MRRGDRRKLHAAFEDAGATLIRTARLRVIAATGVIMRPILMLGLMAIGHRAMCVARMSMTYDGTRRRNLHSLRRRKRGKAQRKNYDDCDERAHGRHDQDTSAPIMERYAPLSIALTKRSGAGGAFAGTFRNNASQTYRRVLSRFLCQPSVLSSQCDPSRVRHRCPCRLPRG